MRNSLSALLAVGLAGLQLVAILVVVFLSYVTSEKVLMDHARRLMGDAGINAAENARSFLSPARGAAELAARLAEHRIVASDDHRQLERFLFQQLQITPQFSGLYYGGEAGDFVYVMRSDGPGPFRSKLITTEGGQRKVELVWRDAAFREIARREDAADRYDPRERPWYQDARTGQTTIWTEPYIFFSSQQPGITMAAPVMAETGGLNGVVGVDIEISDISDFLGRLRIGDHGRAMIINRNGDVIAHPEPSLIRALNEDGTLRFASIAEFGDPIARTAFAGIELPVRHEAWSEFTHDGQNYVANVLPAISAEMPWTIAVYAPQDDFIGAIKRNRAVNIWIAVLVSALTGIAGLALAGYIYRPVRAFAVRSALVAQGEADPHAPLPRTYRELSQANRLLVQQIVARKKAEREYGQTFDLSSRAMAQVSPQSGRFLKVNQRLCDLIGFSAPELLEMRFADLAPPGAGPGFPSLTFASGEEFAAQHETEIRRKDGALLRLTVNAILIRDHAGRPLHAVVTLDDITEAHAREGQIARLNRDLSHLARGNTMGEMASGLAHELNQPLAAIAQNADTGMLLADGEVGAAPELRQILTEIEQQALRAGEIIRALRGFIGKDENDVTAFDLADLVDQARRLVQAEATEGGVAIRTALPALPPVRANRVQIAQVLVNLMRNAIEAMVAAASPQREITVAARRLGDRIEVEVADTGPGIAPGVRLFTQFETTKPGGMGLGLSICRSMIEANGGRLDVDMGVERGALFRFGLPVAPEAAMRPEDREAGA